MMLRLISLYAAIVILAGMLLPACAAAPAATAAPLELSTPAVSQGTQPTQIPSATLRSVTRTPTASPTPTAIEPTRTSTATPEPPPGFSPRLAAGVQPVSYVEDTCRYLSERWDPQKAAPGTIVVPVMYHGVRREGGAIPDNITVGQKYFEDSLAYAHRLGFETVTVDQLVDFLQHNSYIPPRSLFLIIDDRRLGTVRNHFLPLLEKYNWTLVMAYITGVIDDREWQEIKDVLSTGRVEIQPHGFMHSGQTYITNNTPTDIIIQEIYAPLNAFEKHLGVLPRIFIWPGGNFNATSVKEAQRAGYDLAFTAFARGPLMYNWVPLGEPEREMNNPLYVLPRYWSTALFPNLDSAVALAEQASAYAEQARAQELTWYKAHCPDSPPIAGIATGAGGSQP